MASPPPSYSEAVTGSLANLIAPYVDVDDFRNLCLVSRTVYDLYAPRLWADPIVTTSLLRLYSDQQQAWNWYYSFITVYAQTARRSTLDMVGSLDFRPLVAARPSNWFDPNADLRFAATLGRLKFLFPRTRCIVLDGTANFKLDDFDRINSNWPSRVSTDGYSPVPLILSLKGCDTVVQKGKFLCPYWRQLFYLDVSGLPGSMNDFVEPHRSRPLAMLRVLKLRGCQLTDSHIRRLLTEFRGQLWSLDLRDNALTDEFVEVLTQRERCSVLRTAEAFEVEGRLKCMCDENSRAYMSTQPRPYQCIKESEWSGSFSHPERYFADAPAYDLDQQTDPVQLIMPTTRRLTGCERPKSDTLDDMKAAFVGDSRAGVPHWFEYPHVARSMFTVRPEGAAAREVLLTHLHLGGNSQFTMEGLSLLLTRAAGADLEYLDCKDPAIVPRGVGKTLAPAWKMAGFIGRTHLLRPVYASSLQSLRVHHSVVTHVPSLSDPSLTPKETLVMAETVLRERAEMAYPQAFEPDINPRLQRLILTCLPRYSTGPLIDKLTRLLTLAYDQEKAIECAAGGTVSTMRYRLRGPRMLRGLRYIRLEFEPWPTEDKWMDAHKRLARLDAEGLLKSSSTKDGMFSFFGPNAWSPSSTPPQVSPQLPAAGAHSAAHTPSTIAYTPATTADNGVEELVEALNLSGTCPQQAGATEGSAEGGIEGGDADADANASSSRDAGATSVGASGAASAASAGAGAGAAAVTQRIRLAHYPLPETLAFPRNEFVEHFLLCHGSAGIPVWVGSGVTGTQPAVNAYMANLAWPELRSEMLPASPDQIRAGAPPGSFIYNAAWDAILWTTMDNAAAAPPLEVATPPEMQDVVQAIRDFRANARAANRHWTGTVEISVKGFDSGNSA